MRQKHRNLSQKHQVRSDHSDVKSTNTIVLKNRSQISFEERDAKEILSKFGDENHGHQGSFDQDGIIGWEASHRINQFKKVQFFQKEIKPHEKRKFTSKLEPLGMKNIEKSSTNDTISYLKHMLCLLRSSRDANPESILKERVLDQPKIKAQRQKLKQKPNPKEAILQKQNQYNDAKIIDQLINGLTKLPKLNLSKRSTLCVRQRKDCKFTLDKLLI